MAKALCLWLAVQSNPLRSWLLMFQVIIRLHTQKKKKKKRSQSNIVSQCEMLVKNRFIFPLDTVMICLPCMFSLGLTDRKWQTWHRERLSFSSQKVEATVHHADANSPPSLTLAALCLSQIIRKQWSLQRLWSVHSSQRTGDEGAGQRVPPQGNRPRRLLLSAGLFDSRSKKKKKLNKTWKKHEIYLDLL